MTSSKHANTLLEAYPEVQIFSLGLPGDADVRRLFRKALRDSWPAARRFGWKISTLQELEPDNRDVGYTAEDGTLLIKARDPARSKGRLYPYSAVLATLLHEMTHLSYLGHGKAFYKRLVEAIGECAAESSIRREVRAHVCSELLNAVCENDARRARSLLAVLPEAVSCKLPGVGRQLPIEYAAHHGRVALTRLLLEARADADAASSAHGICPLARAQARGNSRTAKVLLAAGATLGEVLTHDNAPQESMMDEEFAVAASSCTQCNRCESARNADSCCSRPKMCQPPQRAESLPALPTIVPVSSTRLQELLAPGGTGLKLKPKGRSFECYHFGGREHGTRLRLGCV